MAALLCGLGGLAARKLKERFRIEAHGLKSAAGNLSAIGLFNAAQILERIGEEARLDAADAAWRLLSMEASRVLDALRHFETRETSARR